MPSKPPEEGRAMSVDLTELSRAVAELDDALGNANAVIDVVKCRAAELADEVNGPEPRRVLGLDTLGLLCQSAARARSDVEQLVAWVDELDDSIRAMAFYPAAPADLEAVAS